MVWAFISQGSCSTDFESRSSASSVFNATQIKHKHPPPDGRLIYVAQPH